jgi:hypothetical protein
VERLKSHTWFEVVKGVKAERATYNTTDSMIVPAIVYRPDPMQKQDSLTKRAVA